MDREIKREAIVRILTGSKQYVLLPTCGLNQQRKRPVHDALHVQITRTLTKDVPLETFQEETSPLKDVA